MSLFLRRSVSESSENLPRSPSLASIRETGSSDSWSTHDGEDRNEKINRKRKFVDDNGNLIYSCDDVTV